MAGAAWAGGGRRVAAAGLLAGAGCAASAQGIFTCVDARGHRLTSDRPIAECLDREQRELNASGTVRRIVLPEPTPQERMAEQERRRGEAQARQQAQEEARRDQVLVARYPDRAAHDAQREAAVRLCREAQDFARQRLAQLQQDRQELDAALAGFRADPSRLPATLRREVADSTAAVEVQERAIASQDEERQRIDARFDAELARLQLLWAAAATGSPPP
jgi:hypothetical protein